MIKINSLALLPIPICCAIPFDLSKAMVRDYSCETVLIVRMEIARESEGALLYIELDQEHSKKSNRKFFMSRRQATSERWEKIRVSQAHPCVETRTLSITSRCHTFTLRVRLLVRTKKARVLADMQKILNE